jgi:hypothetical protein
MSKIHIDFFEFDHLNKMLKYSLILVGGIITANGLVLAAWRHRSRKAFTQNKSSWKNTLCQT